MHKLQITEKLNDNTTLVLSLPSLRHEYMDDRHNYKKALNSGSQYGKSLLKWAKPNPKCRQEEISWVLWSFIRYS